MPLSSPSPTTCQDMPSPWLFSCLAFVSLQSLKASEIAAATSAMDSIGLAEIKTGMYTPTLLHKKGAQFPTLTLLDSHGIVQL